MPDTEPDDDKSLTYAENSGYRRVRRVIREGMREETRGRVGGGDKEMVLGGARGRMRGQDREDSESFRCS